MKHWLPVTVLASSLLAGCGGTGGSSGGGGNVDHAQKLITQRQFDPAASILERYGNDRRALRLLGRLRLNQNRPVEAEKALLRAMELVPKNRPLDMIALQELAWARLRLNNFDGAANAFGMMGQMGELTRARKLALSVPYVPTFKGRSTSVRFSISNPFAAVRVRINGAAIGNFVIDTNVADVVLDAKFAERARPEVAKSQPSVGWVRTIEIGDLTVQNVPVSIQKIPDVGGERISGLIGTSFLSRFLVRFDFKDRRMDLAPLRTQKRGGGLPMMFGADRYLIAKGSLHGSDAWFFLNTSFTLAEFAPRPGMEDRTHLTLGPIQLPRPKMSKTSFPPGTDYSVFGFVVEGVLGYPALKNWSVTFDFHSMRVFIEN